MPYLRFYKMIPVFENIFHIFYFLPHEDYTTALPRPKAFYFDIIRQTPTVSRRFHIKDASRSRLQNNDNPFIPQNKKPRSAPKTVSPAPAPFAADCILLYLFHIKGLSHILLALDFFHVYADQCSLSYRSVDEFHSAFDKVR